MGPQNDFFLLAVVPIITPFRINIRNNQFARPRPFTDPVRPKTIPKYDLSIANIFRFSYFLRSCLVDARKYRYSVHEFYSKWSNNRGGVQ